MRYLNKTFQLSHDPDKTFMIVEEKDFDDTYGAIYLGVTNENNTFIIAELELNIFLRQGMINECPEIQRKT